MDSRTRVINAIERKPVDRAPYSFDLTSKIIKGLAKHYGIDPDGLFSFIGDDLLYVNTNNPNRQKIEKQAEGTYLDEFGVLWDRSDQTHEIGDWGGIIKAPLPEPSLKGYSFPDGTIPGRFSHLDFNALKRQKRFVILALPGLYTTCWRLRGFENFLMDMSGDEKFSCELLDMALNFNLGVINQAPDAINGIRFDEDWGLQKGLIMGIKIWRKLLKPRLKIMYKAARDRGIRIFIHSCGDIRELFDDIIELGVEVVHPVQPEAMDIAKLQKTYGDKLTMYGGLGTQSTLVYGTPDDVVNEAKNRLEIFRDGGYILGPAGAISTDTKIENVAALADFARNNFTAKGK